MSQGSYEGQPGSYSQPGLPPPPQPGQPGHYAQPASAQFRNDYAVPYRRTNALAIASLSCGIGQVIAGPLSGIPAAILGAISLKQIRETGEEGRAMALTGLVLGVVGTLLFVLVLVLIIGLFDFGIHQVHSLGNNT